MRGGTFKNWDKYLAQATWLVNTRGSINQAGLAQSDLLQTVEVDKVPVVILGDHEGLALFWFRLPPATKAPRGRPSPRRGAEENGKKQAETGGSG